MEAKKGRRWFVGIITIITVWGLFLGLTTPAMAASGKKITLKAWSSFPENHPQTRMLHWFREAVNERAGGKLEIVWAGGPELFKTKAIPMAVSARAVDVLSAPIGFFNGILREADLDAGPYWRPENAAALSRELRDEVLNAAFEEKMKIKMLAFPMAVQHNIVTKKPLTDISQMKGLTIRGTPGGILNSIKALGATPITLPAEEVYMALERGVIDGAARPMSSYLKFKEYEVAKHVVSTPLLYSTLGLWITKNAWEKLPKDLQSMVYEEGDRFNERMVDVFVDEDRKVKKRTEGYGVVWHDLPADAEAKWKATVMEACLDLIKDVPKASSDKIFAVLKKFDALP